MKKALVLRTCNPDMTSHSGFIWPKSGTVEAPDWKPTKECGNGLHGFLWGEGDGSLANWYSEAKWLVVEVDSDSVIDLVGKVKFPRGEVVFCGDRLGATGFILDRLTIPRNVIGAAVIAGDKGTASAGNYGIATAGDYGIATAGYNGTATAGNCGTATAGNCGTASAGDYGTATAGDGGIASAGYKGTAAAGDYGTATAGDNGTAIAGNDGTATVGYGGTILITWYDRVNQKYRRACAEVGENGIKPNVKYKLTNDGKFIES